VYTGSDPVEDGLVTSLGRPEGNVTGIVLSMNPQTVMAITVAAPPYSHIATRDPTGRRSGNPPTCDYHHCKRGLL